MIHKNGKKIKWLSNYLALFAFLLAMPASTSYQLKSYGFGSGGTADSTSPNYSLNAITGEQGGGELSGGGYKTESGLVYTEQSNVPVAPALDNPGNFYNRLRLIIDASGNPSDTKFAVAISKDNFVTTQYVQSDATVGNSLGAEDYMTYAQWGGAGGTTIIGLSSGTAYKVKVKAMQGKFTETGYGPSASASTSDQTLSFDIDVSANDEKTDPPFAVNFGSIDAGTVADAPQKIWVDFSTNGDSGGRVYISGENSGLASTVANYKINSVSGNLDALSEGFGVQGSSVSESSGGPFTIDSPYDQSGNTVGLVAQSAQGIFASNGPITGGRASFLLKAKASAVTPSANDYNEIFTVIASGGF